jgi:hypothetical protein
MSRDTIRNKRTYVCGHLKLVYVEHTSNIVTLTVRCGEWEARTSGILTPHATVDPVIPLLRSILRKNKHLRPFADRSGSELILQELPSPIDEPSYP